MINKISSLKTPCKNESKPSEFATDNNESKFTYFSETRKESKEIQITTTSEFDITLIRNSSDGLKKIVFRNMLQENDRDEFDKAWHILVESRAGSNIAKYNAFHYIRNLLPMIPFTMTFRDRGYTLINVKNENICNLFIESNELEIIQHAYNTNSPCDKNVIIWQGTWASDANNIYECIDMANSINSSYPNEIIVSLGQSPSWIVNTIEKIRIHNNNLTPVKYIPFSGSFFYTDSENAMTKLYQKTKQYPNNINIDSYRNLLTEISLDPLTICNNPNKTIIIEHTKSGSGLASFLHVIFSWANDLGVMNGLEQKLHVIIFNSKDRKPLFNIHFQQDENIPPITCATIKVSPKFETQIGNGNGEETGEYSDRLVPSYKSNRWGTELPPYPISSTMTNRISQEIDRYL